MLLGIDLSNLHKSLDETKVLEAITDLIEKHTSEILGRAGGEIHIDPLNEDDDVTEWVRVEVESVGCGDVTSFAEVDFSLGGREISVDAVTLDRDEAIRELEDLGAFSVKVR